MEVFLWGVVYGGVGAAVVAPVAMPFIMAFTATASALGALHAPAAAWGVAALIQSGAVSTASLWSAVSAGAALLALNVTGGSN